MSNLFESVHSQGKKPAKPAIEPKADTDAIMAKLEELGKSPRKWKFTISRDDNGRLSEIVAEAQD